MTQNWFASSIVEERRLCRGGRIVIELEKNDRGWARTRIRGNSVEIDASDTPVVRGMPPSIAELLSTPPPPLPGIPIDPGSHPGWRFHLFTRTRVAVHRGSEPDLNRADLIVSTAPAHDHSHVSIVSTPHSIVADIGRLAKTLSRPPAREAKIDTLPIAWSCGTAAVLFHEALGHPSERGASSVRWPNWLDITDDPFVPAIGTFSADDCGRPVSRRILTKSERPSALRRWSFRDVPITRMSNLCVTASGTPIPLPARHVDVRLVEHGSWDPLTDDVAIRVSLAELVDGDERMLLPRFTIRGTRTELAARLEGWFGNLESYPGVICSDEGQTLPVGSIAVGIVARAR